MLSLDTETELFGPGRLAPPLVCVSYAGLDQAPGLVTHLDAEPILSEWLDSVPLFLGVNMAYDWAVIGAEYPSLLPDIFAAYRAGRVRDVGIDQKLIDIANGEGQARAKRKGSYSLAGLADRLLGVTVDKDDSPRLTFGALRGRPLSEYTPEQRDYALGDAVYPLQIREKQVRIEAAWAQRWGSEYPLLGVGPFRAYADFALHLSSCWGVRSNLGRCLVLEQELDRAIDEAGETLRKAGILRPSGTRNMKAARDYMTEVCRKRGLRPKLTEKGAICLDQEACEVTGDETLAAYTLYTTSNTLRSRVRDLRAGAYVPLQPSYSSLLDTGRTSSRKPGLPLRGIQIQNMPRLEGSRETLEPRPGRIFFGADYSAAELHALGQLTTEAFGSSVLADSLNAGKDIYVDFATDLYGMTYEEVMNHPDKKRLRQSAKPGPLGLPGGLGATTYIQYAAGYGVHLTMDEAQRHIHLFKRKYGDVAKYLQVIGQQIDKGVKVARIFPTPFWRGGLRYASYANSGFQTLTAFGALTALCEVQRLCYTVPDSPLYGCRVWAFVHDEILLEGPVVQAPEAAEELARVMEIEFNRFVPACPTRAEPALFWRWSKGNETVRDENGHLIPSDPENQPNWYAG